METNILRLREWRHSRGLTLKELSEMADITLMTLWRLETGRNKKARRGTVAKIAGALGVRPGLLAWEPQGEIGAKSAATVIVSG